MQAHDRGVRENHWPTGWTPVEAFKHSIHCGNTREVNSPLIREVRSGRFELLDEIVENRLLVGWSQSDEHLRTAHGLHRRLANSGRLGGRSPA